MAYAELADVTKGFRELTEEEKASAEGILDEAAAIIDAYNSNAQRTAKTIVSVRMVRRAIGNGESLATPTGATQGSISALGYSQSWTFGSSGAAGELYLNRTDKKLLGVGDKIGMAGIWND